MKHGLFAELKRRHVYRVAVAYVVVGWLVIQAAATVSPYLHLPDTLTTMVIVVVALGFPVALVLAWAFEVTPDGVRRTPSPDSPDAREPEQRQRVGHTLDRIIIGVLVVAVALLAWRSWRPHAAAPVQHVASASTVPAPASAASSIPAKSIAVLPFENLSTDKANGYFADGMQDLILTKLADISDLKVISRTSTMLYGSHPQNLKQIGHELGVATLLEGSVQKAGDQVLVNVQLINAQTDAHIWAQSYTRTLDNVFGVEGEVASKIAAALRAKLSPAETKRLATALSKDSTANDLFLRAEYFTNQGALDQDGALYRKAIGLYRQALKQDPGFVLARSRLSYAESGLVWFGGNGSSTRALIADAGAQARQAIAQNPDLADAHLALGYFQYWCKQDFAAALESFAAALKLRPNDANALSASAYVMRRQGRFEDAIDTMRQALTLDPRDSLITDNLAETLITTGRYTAGGRIAQRALALNPDDLQAHILQSKSILLSSGDVTRALAAVQGVKLAGWKAHLLTLQRKYGNALKLVEGIPDTPDTFTYKSGPKALILAYLHRLAGDKQRARKLYAQALVQSRARLAALAGNDMMQGFVWNHVAEAELGLGQTDAALASSAKSQSLVAQSGDRYFLPWVTTDNAYIYAHTGRVRLAVEFLAKAFAMPGHYEDISPAMLRIDPAWDPIRPSPAFQALLKKLTADQPAPAGTSATATGNP